MSIASEIERINSNIASAYSACSAKGATLPLSQNSANLASAIGEINTAEHLSWHQCPQPVRDFLTYMSSHTYSSNDYTYTYITDFAPSDANQSNAKPVGKTVENTTFYDNEPYQAVPFCTAGRSGTLTALDSLRWYNTVCRAHASNEYYDGGYNCRDLGGWACDSGCVKYGMLIRSGELNPADKELMVDKIGVKTEVNLLPISVQTGQYSSWGIDWVGNPTDVDFMYRIDDGVKDQWKLYLHSVFDSVAHGKPVIFHCGAGADKTGTMAVMLMGILGCSLQDIDIDYELTSFAHYSVWRNRTYLPYIDYLNALKEFPLVGGLSDSFRNRCISFALSLGITIDEINAFRAACINVAQGQTLTPVSANLTLYSVTNTLTNATNGNASRSVTQFQSYEAEIVPSTDKVIDSVCVTMGGTDITNQVFKGRSAVRRYSVTVALTGCISNNSKKTVIDSESYGAAITPSVGYTLNGATISITMGGTDVSNYYSDGKITIPSVTGNLVITVTAAASAPAYTNLADPTNADWVADARLNSSGAAVTQSGATTTNYISCVPGDVIRVRGMGALNDYSTAVYSSTRVVYSAGKAPTQSAAFSYSYDSASGIVTITVIYEHTAYLRFSGILTGTASDVIITKNEVI